MVYYYPENIASGCNDTRMNPSDCKCLHDQVAAVRFQYQCSMPIVFSDCMMGRYDGLKGYCTFQADNGAVYSYQ